MTAAPAAPGPAPRAPVAYVLGREGFDRIYGPEQRARIAALCGGEPPFLPADDAVGDPRLATAEVLLTGWGAPVMDAAFLAAAPRLRAVLHGAGSVRGFVTDALVRRGVVVASAAAANAVPVADYAVGVTHLALKRFWELAGTAPRGEVDKDVVPGAYGSRVGLVALGAVGRLVAERLRGTDLDVVAHDPYVGPAEAAALGVRLVGLPELFATSDVVSLHLPLHDGTRGVVDGTLLGSMRHRATLVNTARGAVVRTDDLVAVLRARPDLQAVLDVTDPEPLPADHPLRALPNVVLTPHIAGSLGAECHRLGALAADELGRWLAGEPLRHRVDLTGLERSAMP